MSRGKKGTNGRESGLLECLHGMMPDLHTLFYHYPLLFSKVFGVKGFFPKSPLFHKLKRETLVREGLVVWCVCHSLLVLRMCSVQIPHLSIALSRFIYLN